VTSRPSSARIGRATSRFTRLAAATGFIGLAVAGSAAADGDTLTNYGPGNVEAPTSRVNAFSASCAALPCSIRLTKRAYAGGQHIAGLDPTTGPAITMTENPVPLTEEQEAEGDEAPVFAVWFSPSDLRRSLLVSTLNRYGSVELHVHATITDATGATSSASRVITLTEQAHSCTQIDAGGQIFHVKIHKGPVSCGEAQSILRTFFSGGGVEHGSGAEYKRTWTIGNWRCGHGAGGGGCIRGGSNTENASSWIEGYIS
jgi:hypothetical protein